MARKIRTLICAALLGLATLAGGIMLMPVQANAATLSSTQFQTNGSSVRVFKKNENNAFEETDKQGIRFHVEMGADYAYNGTVLLDESAEKHARGSWKMVDGFKTYTLILPTRLLDGDLTVDTAKVLKLDTSEYWYTDSDGNWESVAYVYNVPEARYTDMFSFRGVICTVAEDGTETVVASSGISERMLTEVAKQAYKDTIDEKSNYWGTAEQDNTAAPLIKKFIPTYSITYNVNGTKTTEEVLWGDTPKSVPDFEISAGGYVEKTAAWYDTTNNEEVDLSKAMNWTTDRTLTLMSSTSAEFKLTGIADYNNFTVGTTPYSGAKIYATLPKADFYSADEIASGTSKMIEIDKKAVNVEYQGTGTFGGLQGVWTLLEGSGNGAQVRLIFAFDSSTMKNGDKLVVKGDSVFYANSVMYKLTEDYTIDYSVVNDVEDYGMFLGYLHNSDVKSIENWDEYGDGTRVRIRITFYDDLLINSDFTFVYDGELPEGYTYPAYTKCNDSGAETEITKGYYYWNDGQHTILELEGYAYHNNDELFGVPGIKIVQNGGYYIYEDAMYAYFNGKDWVVGAEKGSFGANAFEVKGRNFTTGTQEIRFTTNANTSLVAGGTTNRWFDKVVAMSVENMSNEPYAVYATKPDGTVTEITEFMYHGQANGNDYNHIFAFKGYLGTVAGEKINIVKGSRFWYGSEYFTATEDIVFYYNGSVWVLAHDGAADYTVTASDFIGQNYNFFEVETYKMRMHFVEAQFGNQTGPLYLESGSIKVNDLAYTNLHYHGAGNNIFELIGKKTSESGAHKVGVNAFNDTLVIEAGTRVWIGIQDGSSATPCCLEFAETIEWRYIGENLRDGSGNLLKYHWVIPNNTDITLADITSMFNATDAGGEVRLRLRDGILTNTFYGFAAMDTSKGVPVVNGVEKPDYAFSYDMNNDLVAVRGGEYGTKLGDYIVIPAGSMWWTTQGSLTFKDEIRGVWNPSENMWNFGFNTNIALGEIGDNNINRIYNYSELLEDGVLEEIRIEIPLGLSDTYYGPVAITEGAYVTKTDGTVVDSVFGYWYGGASGAYTASHSLIGLRATDILGATNGDVLTIKADAKIIFRTASGAEGYRTFGKDVVYTYVDGAWQAGDLNTTATYSVSNATISGDEEVIIGKAYNFTVTPNSGYIVSSVKVNGNTVAINETNTYSFVAGATNEIVVETLLGYNVMFSIATGAMVDSGAIANGTIKAVASGSSLTFTVTAESGYRVGTVTGATSNGDGTYTVVPTADTTITITAVKQWTVTYSLTNVTASVNGISVSNGASVVVDEGTYTVTITPNSGYGISSVTGATSNGDGTYTATVTSDITVSAVASKLYAVEWINPTGATISVTANGSAISSGATVVEGTSISVTATASSGYRLNDVIIGGQAQSGVNKNQAGSSTFNYTVNGATGIDVTTKRMYTVSWTATNANYTVTANGSSISNGASVDTGTAISITVAAKSGYSITAVKINDTQVATAAVSNYSYTVTGNTTITNTAQSSGICIVEGTMILLADGTQKPVEDLQVGDMLMVYDHFNGTFAARAFIMDVHAKEAEALYNVLNMTFSNGAVWRIAGHHTIFNSTLNEYVTISASNVENYVGHTFYYTDGVVSENVTMTGYYETQEVVKVFSPTTFEFANYFANGFLNAPPLPDTLTAGQMNCFEFGDDMKYENVEADIEQYGLYTYEDFAEYISEDVFNALPFKYFKVSVGKGLLTWDEIVGLISMV